MLIYNDKINQSSKLAVRRLRFLFGLSLLEDSEFSEDAKEVTEVSVKAFLSFKFVKDFDK
ncbi:hypothetical protein SeseC_00867 [Streptococcus equi subsp. zooepidemicus ATCC 35246]|nr:hypothetical protein SeseC_00867 [Streptococcus equi subsp. zooepidemicus ATCC 35246]